MIAKIPKPGKSFKGCVQYNMQKKDAELLDAIGVRVDTVAHMIRDLDMQRKMNPALGQAVGHIALSWSNHDQNKLSNDVMRTIAYEYLNAMKIRDTQLLIVRHQDKEHPHLHIIYNRVDDNGKTIPDNFQHQRSARVCRVITEKHGFYIAAGKEQVKRQQLTGADKVRYEIHDEIRAALVNTQSMNELKDKLSTNSIEVIYKYRSGNNEVQGISFTKDGYTFKGSEIDRSMSFGNLTKSIEANIEQEQRTVQRSPTLAEQMRQALREKREEQVQHERTGPFRHDVEITTDHRSVDADISIADDVDDEAIHGRNRRRKQQARTNTR